MFIHERVGRLAISLEVVRRKRSMHIEGRLKDCINLRHTLGEKLEVCLQLSAKFGLDLPNSQ